MNQLLLVHCSQPGGDLRRNFQRHLYLQLAGAFDEVLDKNTFELRRMDRRSIWRLLQVVKGISIAKQVTLVLTVWFAIAVFSSASGATLALRPPFPQVVLCGLLGLLFVAFGYLKAFRSWLYAIPLYWLVAVHISRFVGAYFLILYHRNELPFAFAVPGGCGDIVVAAFATVLVILRCLSRAIPPALYWIWNTLGLIDILFVMTTATRLALRDPNSMVALLHLPLSLLPTFLVPLIIFTHIIIAIRLFRLQRFSAT